jgi:hypothetical protein
VPRAAAPSKKRIVAAAPALQAKKNLCAGNMRVNPDFSLLTSPAFYVMTYV